MFKKRSNKHKKQIDDNNSFHDSICTTPIDFTIAGKTYKVNLIVDSG